MKAEKDVAQQLLRCLKVGVQRKACLNMPPSSHQLVRSNACATMSTTESVACHGQ